MMPVLTEGQTVRSREPTILVENRFEPGNYRFRLVVIDDERKNLEAFLTESHPGFESLAAEVKAILK